MQFEYERLRSSASDSSHPDSEIRTIVELPSSSNCISTCVFPPSLLDCHSRTIISFGIVCFTVTGNFISCPGVSANPHSTVVPSIRDPLDPPFVKYLLSFSAL